MSTVELRAERLAAGGDAIAREASGRVVLVRGALPGERVAARIVDEHRDYARATVSAVTEASPDRVAPPCPAVARGCGGCSWQHIRPAAQPELKQRMIEEALTRIAHASDADVRLGPPLDPWGFRTTVRLAVVDGRAGFHAHRRHRVVTVDRCMVAHPLVDELLTDARFPGADEVVLRAGAATGERLVLVTPSSASRRALLPADVSVGRHAHIHEVIDGVRLRISARSFFQSRHDGAEALVALVRAAAATTEPNGNPFVDAYAGVGLFAATVAPTGADVIALEQSRSAANDARHNLSEATVIATPVERWRPRPAHTVIADPARRGLGADAVNVLAATNAPRLVLVSCDAAALARDTRLLGAAGYTHRWSTVLDLFPHTPHVEVVTRFDRR